MAKRRRRPRHLRGPKIYGYSIPDGIRTHAGDALKGAGLYTVAWRDVHRRKRKLAKEGVRENYYFVFTKGGTWHEPADEYERTGMSLTHRMLQELIREYGFVQCEVNGEILWFLYREVQLEKHSGPVFEIGKGTRQTDVSGIVEKTNEPRIRNIEVGVEIGVTSLVVTYDRYYDIVKAGIPMLEIVVERIEKLEKEPAKLVKHLKKMLLDGKLKGRWIVAPWRKGAEIQSLDSLMQKIGNEVAAEEERHKDVLRQLETLERELTQIPATEKMSKRELQRLEALDMDLWNALDIAERRMMRDVDDVDWLTKVVEWVMPPLKAAREQTVTERLERAKNEIRNDAAIKRAGLLSEFTKMQDTVRKRNDERETKRRDLLLQIATLSNVAPRLQHRIESLRASLAKLGDLEKLGMKRFLIPSGTSVENAIAFEHGRWCR